MSNSRALTGTEVHSGTLKPLGGRLGLLTPTPEDDEGTYELLITPEVSHSLSRYVQSTTETIAGGDASSVWRQLGFHPAVCSLLKQIAAYRSDVADEEIVRLLTIDEAQHGPCAGAIAGIEAALARIENARERARPAHSAV